MIWVKNQFAEYILMKDLFSNLIDILYLFEMKSILS